MKEEILTAKEWLEKEGYIDNFPKLKNEDKFMSDFGNIFVYTSAIMEKYANYKNRILEDRIKEFRQRLEEELMRRLTTENMGDLTKVNDINDQPIRTSLFEYDKHFNIENKQ